MAAPRALALVLLLVASSLAGCNYKLWSQQSGTFHIELLPQGPENSSLTDFQRLKIAIYGVTLKQLQFINPKEFTYGDSPLVVDFLKAGLNGEAIPIAEGQMTVRAAEHVTIRLDVVEAVDAQGKSVPVCREGQEEPTSFPCFFLPATSAFRIADRPFSPPRGGDVTFGFPLAVKAVEFRGDTEYFFIADPALTTIEQDR